MGGTTLHAGGDIAVGGQSSRQLHHTDVDVLFTRNQHLRFVLVDEIGMIPDDLLGAFAEHYTEAAAQTRFSKRADKSNRVMGGYNLLMFGDLYQLPPIPASAAVSTPRTEKKTEQAKRAHNLFWGDDADAVNNFIELDEQQRLEKSEVWYGHVLNECRFGGLADESLNFLMGLPTEHAGSRLPDCSYGCSSLACRARHEQWRAMRLRCKEWPAMIAEETCTTCREERERRNRLVEAGDPRVQEEPFVSAPYIHRNNEPKYHALLLRAEEHAKKKQKYRLWFAAQDKPCNPAELAKNAEQLKAKMARFLQFHDQKTAGIPGLCILYASLQMRVTEKIINNSKVTILKHTPCTVVGWELHRGDRKRVDDGERFLDYLPTVIYVQFEEADWQVDAGLAHGVFPLYPVERTWMLNSETGVKIVRKGYTLIPNYASTAFMIQGTSFPAALADCGDVQALAGMGEMMTAYVILSRVKKASGLLLLRAFSPYLFQQGVAPGPYCLLKLLRASFSSISSASALEDATSGEAVPSFTPAAAMIEYEELTARRDAENT